MRFLSYQREKFSKWIRDHILLHFIVVCYIIIFCIVTLIKHYAFQSSAWDLGIFNQACYSTLHGKLFYYTAELYANPNGSIFGVHFSPVLFLVLPFYAIFRGPETLLVVQTVVLAIGAYPVFFIAQHLLKSKRIAWFFSLLYLLYPHVHGVNIFDFHPDCFFILFTLLSLHFFLKGKWKEYFVFMFLAFSVKEFSPLMFLVFGLIDIWLMRDRFLECLKKRELTLRVVAPLLTVIAAVIWYIIAVMLIHFFNPSPPKGFVQGSPWVHLGGNPLNPLTWIDLPHLDFLMAVGFDFQPKIFYLITILTPLAFLPAFRLRIFSPVLLWLFLAFLSNYPPYYHLGWHYSALVVPFAIVSAIEGFYQFGLRFNLDEKSMYRIAKKLTIVGGLSALALTYATFPLTNVQFILISKHDEKVQETLQWILNSFPNATILTQHDIFPHVSSSLYSYVIPPPFSAFRRFYYFDYVDSLFDKGFDFIIIDIDPDVKSDHLRFVHHVTLTRIKEGGEYGLYASVDGVLVYKRGYKGDLVRFEPFTITNLYRMKTPMIRDTTFYEYSLPPGVYNVTFRVKIDPKIEGRAFTIEIRQENVTLVSKKVYGTEFAEAGVYQGITAFLNVYDPSKEIKFLIVDSSPSTEVYVDSMEITIMNHFVEN